jgi:hypothetical protein
MSIVRIQKMETVQSEALELFTPFNISNAYVLIIAAVLKFPIFTKL